jgi:hypothetical protein
MDVNNVISLRPKNPLFPAELRAKFEDGVKSVSDDPKKLVDQLEDALCAWLVGSVKAFVTKVATRTGERLAQKMASGG